MTRPESVDDLTPDQRRGPEFASFDLGAFPVDGELITKYGEFIDRCTSLFGEVEIVRPYGRINCYATPSETQLTAILAQQQSLWDDREKLAGR